MSVAKAEGLKEDRKAVAASHGQEIASNYDSAEQLTNESEHGDAS